jgi:hypothetical protein
MKHFSKFVLFTSVFCLFNSAAYSDPVPLQSDGQQAATDQTPEGSQEDGRLDFLVPDAPALALIGVAADTALRPRTAKEFVTDFRSAFDENGKLKSTVSIAFVPYLLLAGDSVTNSQYNSDNFVRALSNMEVSLVGARGESTNDADRYAASLRWNVLDNGDPWKTNIGCSLRVANAAVDAQQRLKPNEATPAARKLIEDAARKEMKETCYKDWRRDYWNAQALDIGLAYAWADGGTNLTGLEENSFGAYASWAFPVSGKDGQVITHARYTVDQLAVSKAGGFFNQDAGYVGARWRHKLGDRSAINLEAGYTFTDPVNMPSDSYAQYGVSFEYRLSENLWLVASTGGRSDADNEDDDVRGLAAFKWNLSDASSIFD